MASSEWRIERGRGLFPYSLLPIRHSLLAIRRLQ